MRRAEVRDLVTVVCIAALLAFLLIVRAWLPVDAANRSGIAAYADQSHGSRYLAIPEGPGVPVTICHARRCIDRVSTDAGPDRAMQRAGRVADLSYVDFAYLCGCDPRQRGLIRVTITYSGARATVPPTDTTSGRCLRWLAL